MNALQQHPGLRGHASACTVSTVSFGILGVILTIVGYGGQPVVDNADVPSSGVNHVRDATGSSQSLSQPSSTSESISADIASILSHSEAIHTDRSNPATSVVTTTRTIRKVDFVTVYTTPSTTISQDFNTEVITAHHVPTNVPILQIAAEFDFLSALAALRPSALIQAMEDDTEILQSTALDAGWLNSFLRLVNFLCLTAGAILNLSVQWSIFVSFFLAFWSAFSWLFPRWSSAVAQRWERTIMAPLTSLQTTVSTRVRQWLRASWNWLLVTLRMRRQVLDADVGEGGNDDVGGHGDGPDNDDSPGGGGGPGDTVDETGGDADETSNGTNPDLSASEGPNASMTRASLKKMADSLDAQKAENAAAHEQIEADRRQIEEERQQLERDRIANQEYREALEARAREVNNEILDNIEPLDDALRDANNMLSIAVGFFTMWLRDNKHLTSEALDQFPGQVQALLAAGQRSRAAFDARAQHQPRFDPLPPAPSQSTTAQTPARTGSAQTTGTSGMEPPRVTKLRIHRDVPISKSLTNDRVESGITASSSGVARSATPSGDAQTSADGAAKPSGDDVATRPRASTTGQISKLRSIPERTPPSMRGAVWPSPPTGSPQRKRRGTGETPLVGMEVFKSANRISNSTQEMRAAQSRGQDRSTRGQNLRQNRNSARQQRTAEREQPEDEKEALSNVLAESMDDEDIREHAAEREQRALTVRTELDAQRSQAEEQASIQQLLAVGDAPTADRLTSDLAAHVCNDSPTKSTSSSAQTAFRDGEGGSSAGRNGDPPASGSPHSKGSGGQGSSKHESAAGSPQGPEDGSAIASGDATGADTASTEGGNDPQFDKDDENSGTASAIPKGRSAAERLRVGKALGQNRNAKQEEKEAKKREADEQARREQEAAENARIQREAEQKAEQDREAEEKARKQREAEEDARREQEAARKRQEDERAEQERLAKEQADEQARRKREQEEVSRQVTLMKARQAREAKEVRDKEREERRHANEAARIKREADQKQREEEQTAERRRAEERENEKKSLEDERRQKEEAERQRLAQEEKLRAEEAERKRLEDERERQRQKGGEEKKRLADEQRAKKAAEAAKKEKEEAEAAQRVAKAAEDKRKADEKAKRQAEQAAKRLKEKQDQEAAEKRRQEEEAEKARIEEERRKAHFELTGCTGCKACMGDPDYKGPHYGRPTKASQGHFRNVSQSPTVPPNSSRPESASSNASRRSSQSASASKGLGQVRKASTGAGQDKAAEAGRRTPTPAAGDKRKPDNGQTPKANRQNPIIPDFGRPSEPVKPIMRPAGSATEFTPRQQPPVSPGLPGPREPNRNLFSALQRESSPKPEPADVDMIDGTSHQAAASTVTTTYGPAISSGDDQMEDMETTSNEVAAPTVTITYGPSISSGDHQMEDVETTPTVHVAHTRIPIIASIDAPQLMLAAQPTPRPQEELSMLPSRPQEPEDEDMTTPPRAQSSAQPISGHQQGSAQASAQVPATEDGTTLPLAQTLGQMNAQPLRSSTTWPTSARLNANGVTSQAANAEGHGPPVEGAQPMTRIIRTATGPPARSSAVHLTPQEPISVRAARQLREETTEQRGVRLQNEAEAAAKAKIEDELRRSTFNKRRLEGGNDDERFAKSRGLSTSVETRKKEADAQEASFLERTEGDRRVRWARATALHEMGPAAAPATIRPYGGKQEDGGVATGGYKPGDASYVEYLLATKEQRKKINMMRAKGRRAAYKDPPNEYPG